MTENELKESQKICKSLHDLTLVKTGYSFNRQFYNHTCIAFPKALNHIAELEKKLEQADKNMKRMEKTHTEALGMSQREDCAYEIVLQTIEDLNQLVSIAKIKSTSAQTVLERLHYQDCVRTYQSMLYILSEVKNR